MLDSSVLSLLPCQATGMLTFPTEGHAGPWRYEMGACGEALMPCRACSTWGN